jgi:hypothetical protein
MTEFKVGNSTKLRVNFVEEKTTRNGDPYWVGGTGVSMKKNPELGWDKDNIRYANFRIKSFYREPLQNGDIIQMDDFYMEKSSYKKDGNTVYVYNLIINKFHKVDAENKPQNSKPVEVQEELPF